MFRSPQWRMTPKALFRLVLALVLALAYALNSRAQEQATDVLAADVENTATSSASSAAIDATLASINASNPDSPIEWLQAVVTLRRMGAYSEANSFLAQVIGASLDEQDKVELHQAIGTAELVKVSVDPNLPDAREFVISVFDAVRTVQRNPARLLELAQQLGDKDEAVRRAAMTKLAQAGPYAMPVLIELVRQQESNVSLQMVEAAMARLGNDAEEPLLALLGAPDPLLQGVAARVLGKISSRRASLHLMRPYFIGQTDAQQAAAGVFQELRSVPSSVYGAAELLTKRAKHHLDGNPPIKTDVDDTIEMWTWSAEQNSVVPNVLNSKAAGAVTAARLARDAYELYPNLDTARLLLVSRLQVDQSLGGLDELLPKGIGSAYQIGRAQGITAACSALEYSLDNGHEAAAVGACELISHLCHASPEAGSGWTPLVRALQYPSRRVRYAAVRSIMKIDPRQRFVGSSFLMEALIDLAKASGSPGAVVGMPRRDANDNLSGLLSSMGFSVAQANEGRPLLKLATSSSDYDVLFVSDSVSLPAAGETIQQLRKHPYTKNLPIVLMARNDNIERATRIAYIDHMTLVLPEFADEQALIATLEKAEAFVKGSSVTPTQRLAQARDAIAWLTHLAQYSQTYSWYDLQRAENVALRAALQPGLSQAAVTLLGYLGGAKAQQQLVELVGQRGASADDRQRAATAFTEAVVRHGLMLRSTDVYRQYDRYNLSEAEDVSVQEILGQVLDVIESQTQPTPVSQVSY